MTQKEHFYFVPSIKPPCSLKILMFTHKLNKWSQRSHNRLTYILIFAEGAEHVMNTPIILLICSLMNNGGFCEIIIIMKISNTYAI